MADETKPDDAPPPDVPTARLIVKHEMIFQPMRTQAEEIVGPNDGTFILLLHTDPGQQPWKRRNVKVGREWLPLKLGWVDEDPHPPSRVTVLNDEGMFQFIPTPEERARVAARIIEVGVGRDGGVESFTEVRPHEHYSFRPLAGAFYFLRCRSDDGASVTVAAVPGDGR